MKNKNFHYTINTVGKYYSTPDWLWDTSKVGFNDFDIFVVVEGGGLFTTPHGTYDLSAGDCFVLRGGEKYVGISNSGKLFCNLYIHFNYVIQGKIYKPPTIDLPPFHRKIDSIIFFETLVWRIIEAHRLGETESARFWLAAVLNEIRRIDQHKILSGLELEKSQIIESICLEINNNPSRSYSIREMAERIHYTPDHFTRIFKKVKGVSPQDYVVNSRLEQAKTMLINSSYNIAHIAENLGYCDPYFFSKQFKKKVGITPKDYRLITLNSKI